MSSGFLIGLREGLEAALILAILLTYLGRTGRRNESRYVWAGAGSAAVACLVAGILVWSMLDGLHGRVEYAVEGGIALAATVVLTHMVFWMRRHARGISAELRERVDRAATGSLVVIAFVAVAREGLETVLFLLGAETSSSSGAGVLVGGLLGLAAAAAIGVLVFAGGRSVNLAAFFNATAVLLLLFAAGLASKAVHELIELASLDDAWFAQPAWTVAEGPWASGTFYDFVHGLLGWSSRPEIAAVAVYVAFLVPTVALYLKRTGSTKPDDSGEGSPARASLADASR